ncbi:MAG: hypothetical protein IJZ68_10605 [Bacteroidaceae bacterium]|nr:hypothetical protein [Bacteroidaceae bacterium]
MNQFNKIRLLIITVFTGINLQTISSQTFNSYTTTENNVWITGKTSMKSKATSPPILIVTGDEDGVEFRAWGTTFNELDWKQTPQSESFAAFIQYIC